MVYVTEVNGSKREVSRNALLQQQDTDWLTENLMRQYEQDLNTYVRN